VKRLLLVIVVFALVVLTGTYLAWQYSRSTTTQWAGEIVARVEIDEKVVALTFDDGPMPGYTQRVLEILEREDVRATFFLVGEAIAAHPVEAALIAEAGHEIGNHSYTHSRMVLKSYDFVASELQRTDALIRTAGHAGPIHFRPPYGKKLFNLPRYLEDHGVVSITWDVEPESYGEGPRSRDDLVRGVLDAVRPGSIVLLHVMFRSRSESMAAVPGIVKGLRERGYRFVTVSEMLEYRQPKH